jgi:hypothetical protein
VIVGLLVASHTVPLSVSVIFGQRVSQTVSGSASGSISVIVSQQSVNMTRNEVTYQPVNSRDCTSIQFLIE